MYYKKLYTNDQLANNVTVYWLALSPKMSLN